MEKSINETIQFPASSKSQSTELSTLQRQTKSNKKMVHLPQLRTNQLPKFWIHVWPGHFTALLLRLNQAVKELIKSQLPLSEVKKIHSNQVCQWLLKMLRRWIIKPEQRMKLPITQKVTRLFKTIK